MNGKRELEILPEDLAVSPGEIQIESISGNTSQKGLYGILSCYNSHKAMYKLEEDTSNKEETFTVVITNGTHSLPVNIKINLN